MKKKQFMTSVAMVAIVANGMIQTAPAETATEHSEGIQVVQNTSEVVSTGSVEEAKENLKQAKENTKQTKKQLDDAEQKLQEANSDKDTANQAYEEQVKAEEEAKNAVAQVLAERQTELEQGLRVGQETRETAKKEKDVADQAVLDAQNQLTKLNEEAALAERTYDSVHSWFKDATQDAVAEQETRVNEAQAKVAKKEQQKQEAQSAFQAASEAVDNAKQARVQAETVVSEANVALEQAKQAETTAKEQLAADRKETG